jgi:hypothetical protein
MVRLYSNGSSFTIKRLKTQLDFIDIGQTFINKVIVFIFERSPQEEVAIKSP